MEQTDVQPVAQPARQFSPAMQILDSYHYSFLQKLNVNTVNEHKNICIAGLNRRAGYATAFNNYKFQTYKTYIYIYVQI